MQVNFDHCNEYQAKVKQRLAQQAEERRLKEQEDNDTLAFRMPNAHQMFNINKLDAINIYETEA